MNLFRVALGIAALGGAMFIFQVNQIGHLNEECAVLRSQIDQHNSFSGNAGSLGRAFFDGLTLGSFADEGIFTEAKVSERETSQLTSQQASLNYRYGNAVFYRNAGFILLIAASAFCYFLKHNSQPIFGKCESTPLQFNNPPVTVSSKLVTEDSYRDENIVDAQIIISCNNCGQNLRITPKNTKIRLKCGKCKQEFYYPA